MPFVLIGGRYPLFQQHISFWSAWSSVLWDERRALPSSIRGGARLTDHEVWKIERSKKKHSQNNVLVMQITEEYFTFSGDMFYIELQKRHSISEPLQRNITVR